MYIPDCCVSYAFQCIYIYIFFFFFGGGGSSWGGGGQDGCERNFFFLFLRKFTKEKNRGGGGCLGWGDQGGCERRIEVFGKIHKKNRGEGGWVVGRGGQLGLGFVGGQGGC